MIFRDFPEFQEYPELLESVFLASLGGLLGVLEKPVSARKCMYNVKYQ